MLSQGKCVGSRPWEQTLIPVLHAPPAFSQSL